MGGVGITCLKQGPPEEHRLVALKEQPERLLVGLLQAIKQRSVNVLLSLHAPPPVPPGSGKILGGSVNVKIHHSWGKEGVVIVSFTGILTETHDHTFRGQAMKTIIGLTLLLSTFLAVEAVAEAEGDRWMLQPRIAIGKLLPGSSVGHAEWRTVTEGYIPSPIGGTDYRYEGTTLDLTLRAFPSPWVALTLGGGVNWFYRSDRPAASDMQPAAAGVGEQLAPGDFVAFPFALGLQAVFPASWQHDFMLFAGLEGRVNFISGDIPMDQQVKLGYALTAGFAAKVFELGLRYEAFSDMRNLGAYLGFRLNPFELSPSGGGI